MKYSLPATSPFRPFSLGGKQDRVPREDVKQELMKSQLLEVGFGLRSQPCTHLCEVGTCRISPLT